MENILISACFLGINVRYNGKKKLFIHDSILQWKKEGRLITVCPEVCGGLPTPRSPAEIQTNNNDILVIDYNGKNVTSAFEKGAQHALSLCLRHNIKYALLKESSPSCGSNFIYDGSFTNKKVVGKGITAKLLASHSIRVFSEETIDDLANLLTKTH